jgi:hypothetical protein
MDKTGAGGERKWLDGAVVNERISPRFREGRWGRPGKVYGMGKAHIIASSPTDKNSIAHFCLLV